ncbi:MAG TPA: hypothetical protein DCG19_00215 [Cryomorphaceae bacterium]|nr:hypothetical protein [Cryomorphaceae bacterium]
MSGEWNKLKEKLEARDLQPRASDWDKMKTVISRHPDLMVIPMYKRPAFKGFMAGMALLIGGGLWWFSGNESASGDENNVAGSNEVVQEAEKPSLEPQLSGAQNPGSKIEQAGNISLNKDAADDEQTMSNGSDQLAGANSSSEDIAASNVLRSGTADQASETVDGPEFMASVSTTAGNSVAGSSVQQDMSLAVGISPAKNVEDEAWDLFRKSVHFTDIVPENELRDIAEEKPDEEITSFLNPATGFRLGRVYAMADYAPYLQKDRAYAIGAGMELEFLSQGFIAQTGLYLTHHNYPYYITDSTSVLDVTSEAISRLDSSWKIDGPFQGHYEYFTVYDTIYDTTITYQQNNRAAHLAYRYLEVPVMFGYRWKSRTAHWNFDLTGGIIAGWLNYDGSNGESGATLNALKLDVALRPSVSYQFYSGWSVVGRVGWRYNVLDHTNMANSTKAANFPFLQLGVAYSF